MENVENLMREMRINTFEVGSSCWVDITHINTPIDFYVRPRAYNIYLNSLQAKGIKNNSNIEFGSIVIYKSRTKRNYIRGRVLCVGSNNPPLFSIFAMDYGFLETSISLKRIWGPCDIPCIPSLVTQCGLVDCVPYDGYAFNEEATSAMKTLVDGECARMFVRSNRGSCLQVELYNSGPDDISTLLAYAQFSRLAYVVPDVSRFATNIYPNWNTGVSAEIAAGSSPKAVDSAQKNAGDGENKDFDASACKNSDGMANKSVESNGKLIKCRQ